MFWLFLVNFSLILVNFWLIYVFSLLLGLVFSRWGCLGGKLNIKNRVPIEISGLTNNSHKRDSSHSRVVRWNVPHPCVRRVMVGVKREFSPSTPFFGQGQHCWPKNIVISVLSLCYLFVICLFSKREITQIPPKMAGNRRRST